MSRLYKIGENKIDQIGELDIPNWHRLAKAIITPSGVCTCIHCQSNNCLQKVLVRCHKTK